jgi:hypothetical protein
MNTPIDKRVNMCYTVSSDNETFITPPTKSYSDSSRYHSTGNYNLMGRRLASAFDPRFNLKYMTTVKISQMDFNFILNKVRKGEDREKIIWSFIEDKEENQTIGEIKLAVTEAIEKAEEILNAE